MTAGGGLLIDLLVEFACIILRSQVSTVWINGVLYYVIQRIGVSTGLSCATQIANIYLMHLDRHVWNTLGANLLLYKRFIDDTLVITDSDCTENILQVMNSSGLVVGITHDASDTDEILVYIP